MLPSPGRSSRQRRQAQGAGGGFAERAAARAAGAAAAAPLPQWDDVSFLQPFRPITWMSNTLPRRASVSSTLCLSEGSLDDLEHELAAEDEYNYNNAAHPKAVGETGWGVVRRWMRWDGLQLAHRGHLTIRD